MMFNTFSPAEVRMRPTTAFVILLSVACAVAQERMDATPPAVPAKDFTGQITCPVLRVAAGNEMVVKLDGQETTVRLIGAYVPQTGPDADAARAFTTRLLSGEAVYLAYEPTWPPRDRAGRVWAYMYRAPDGLLVNLELVRQGYARVSTAQPFEHQQLLRAYERLAQNSGKGLWSAKPAREPASSRPAVVTTSAPATAEQPAGDDVLVYVTEHGRKYHTQNCQYVRHGGKAITLKEAKARGLSACSRCKPPR
jgi:micrococcal nuclease